MVQTVMQKRYRVQHAGRTITRPEDERTTATMSQKRAVELECAAIQRIVKRAQFAAEHPPAPFVQLVKDGKLTEEGIRRGIKLP